MNYDDDDGTGDDTAAGHGAVGPRCARGHPRAAGTALLHLRRGAAPQAAAGDPVPGGTRLHGTAKLGLLL